MAEIKSVQVTLDKNICELLWKDGHVSRFHARWLRYNCRCDKCKLPFPNMSTVDVLQLPAVLTICEAHASKDGTELYTKYHGEILPDHEARHEAAWLRDQCYCDSCLEAKIEQRDVISRHIKSNKKKEVPTMEYQEILDDPDRGLFKLITILVDIGLCVIKKVPAEHGMVMEVAKKIAFIEPSTYGEMFEVFAKGAENGAYTTLKLPFHQDQPTYESSPGVQFLHSIRFDDCVTGGESVQTDLYEAVEILRSESPQHFKTLTEVPVMYHTIDINGVAPRYLQCQKYHIHIDYFGKIVEVNWSLGLNTAPQVREDDVDRYYIAYRALLEIIRRPESQYRFKLDCGDLIAFNNRRMLHGREEYVANGGTRHLQGTYVKIDDLKSKYVTLAHKLNIPVVPPKVGNRSSF